MALLNEQQRQRALEIMREYLSAPSDQEGKTLVQIEVEFDAQRMKLIEHDLKPLISNYLNKRIPLSEFKSKVDGINKRNELWGFRGTKGQMFFNMIVNVAEDEEERDQEIKAAIAIPDNEPQASSKIKTFSAYVQRLRDKWLADGKSGYGAPKLGGVAFFLSYFWQIQAPLIWPVYYTSSVQVMNDMNLWQPSGNMAEDYLTFKHIHEELAEVFKGASGQHFGLYEVEHVFWYKGGNPFKSAKPIAKDGATLKVVPSIKNKVDKPEPSPADGLTHLPESYIPPVISILPLMARNTEALIEAAKRSGTTIDRAFEKYINTAFTVLGYETTLLGKGKGRVPDGVAIARDDSYAIVWDAKVRADGYSMGTDDRTIREYIQTQSRELKRRRSLRNIYYLIVSSEFADDYDDVIRSIKMETDVNEVILVEAEALIAIVDAKLRNPLQITLGPDGLQRLFSTSGVLSAEVVREYLI